MRLVAFLLVFIGVDRIVYLAAFPQFDKMMRLTTLEAEHDALIVGSSHVFWDLDHRWISRETGLQIGMASVPGASMELRYHLVRDYLERHGRKPRVIVVEADKYSFDGRRYPETSPRALIGYYHRGILSAFFAERLGITERLLYGCSQTYALNSQFSFIGARIYDRAGEILDNVFGPALSVLGLQGEHTQPTLDVPAWFPREAPSGGPDDKAGTTDVSAAAHEDLGDGHQTDPRLDAWREQYRDLGVRVDPAAVRAFRKLIELVETYPQTKLILLDTPNLMLLPSLEERFDREVRSVLRENLSDRILFWRLDPHRFEQNLDFFADASHFNLSGRVAYTQAFTEHLRQLR